MYLDQQIIQKYVREQKSLNQTAKELGTNANYVKRRLKFLGQHIRDKAEAQKLALETGAAVHPTAGKKRTEQERLAISKSLSSYWQGMSDTEKRRRAELAKSYWEQMSPIEREKLQTAAIEAIQKAGKEGSKFEHFLLKELSYDYKINFHEKQIFSRQKLEIDLFLPGLKTIIEVDGPSHFLPLWGEEKLEKQIKADADKTGLMLAKGYVVIRVCAMKTLNFAEQHSILLKLKRILLQIKTEFPQETERYIEVHE